MDIITIMGHKKNDLILNDVPGATLTRSNDAIKAPLNSVEILSLSVSDTRDLDRRLRQKKPPRTPFYQPPAPPPRCA